MGDFDGEIYRGVNDIYGEVITLKDSVNSLNDTMRQVLDEIRGLRQDMMSGKIGP